MPKLSGVFSDSNTRGMAGLDKEVETRFFELPPGLKPKGSGPYNKPHEDFVSKEAGERMDQKLEKEKVDGPDSFHKEVEKRMAAEKDKELEGADAKVYKAPEKRRAPGGTFQRKP